MNEAAARSDPSKVETFHLEPGTDQRPRWRRMLAEAIGLASMHGAIAQDYAALGDDVGLRYAVTRFLLYANAVESLMARITTENKKPDGDAHGGG